MSWELDETQREAVEASDRAVMVVAGPGTGKTRVLTARAVWLTEKNDVDPAKILAITYTNRATAEMRSRLVSRKLDSGQPSPASEVAVSTFHSWAYRLVRKYSEVLDFPREPVVFDEASQEQILRKILGEKRIPEEAIAIRHLKQLLDRVKADVAYPLMDARYDPEHFELLYDIFKTYQEELVLRGALDFSDILLTALRLLYLHPDIRDEITGSVEHLLIDEFQDINPAQYRLIDALEHPGMDLFAVGDEDQTIYAFRGSSGVYIDQFVADFGARLIPLGKSYRCSSSILYAASSLISKNRRFYQQPTRPPEGIKKKPPLGIFELENEDEEARLITKLVRSWVEAGIEYKDVAILYRVHFLADECESVLINNGIPVIRLLPDRQREEIPGDPLPLLRLAAQDNEWDWDRAIGLPRDRLGELDDLRVRLAAIKEGVQLRTLLGRPTRFRKLSAFARTQLARLNSFVRSLKKQASGEAPSALINLVAEYMHAGSAPLTRNEDGWLQSEHSELAGFDNISIESLIAEWKNSPDGIRIFFAPSITALIAAMFLREACEDFAGISVKLIPFPHEIPGDFENPVDERPVCIVGLNHTPEGFYPPATLIARAVYVTDAGVSETPPDEPRENESFSLALSAHRLASAIVGFRPGGGEDEILVFFDLETTGIEIFRAEIIEIAAIKVVLERGGVREIGEFHSLVKPTRPIPPAAKAVHGISDADVKDASGIAEILPRFLDFIGDAPLAGHNIDRFDIPLLKRHAGKTLDRTVPNLSLDTLGLSKRLFPGEPHSLGVLADKFGIDKGRQHRALDDVRTNISVFEKLVEGDDSYRARSFSRLAPVALAIACGLDETADTDISALNNAAARILAEYSGNLESSPSYVRLADHLNPHGRKTVLKALGNLARRYYEVPGEIEPLHAKIHMLRVEALRLEDENPDVSLVEFLAHIALLTEGEFDSDDDAVRMMTLHAAKGLEFDRVIILGLEQGNLPYRLALGKTVAEIEEERRLCYVGITRARTRAALTYTRRRGGTWRSPSMFISELPRHTYKLYRTRDRVAEQG